MDKKNGLARIDKKTGRPAIKVFVGKIGWLNEQSVEVGGGYHCGGLCAAGITYELKRKDGKWAILSEEMRWIS